jgi:hypothetical protein
MKIRVPIQSHKKGKGRGKEGRKEREIRLELGMMRYIVIPVLGRLRQREWRVPGQPGLHIARLSQKNSKRGGERRLSRRALA